MMGPNMAALSLKKEERAQVAEFDFLRFLC